MCLNVQSQEELLSQRLLARFCRSPPRRSTNQDFVYIVREALSVDASVRHSYVYCLYVVYEIGTKSYSWQQIACAPWFCLE